MNYLKKYFTDPKNVANDKISAESQNVPPDEFFRMIEPQQANAFILFNKIECKDWFTMSVQASYWHYCNPRTTCYSKYSFVYDAMEVWYPSEKEESLMEYCEDSGTLETVYAFVPVEVINKVIEKHWGIIDNN